jgi:preprotein translocase subunit SecE
MEVKKAQVIPEAQSKAVPENNWNAKDFLGNIKSEFSKISWTNPEELRVYTKIVVGATFILGIGIYGIDLLIQAALNTLGFIVRFIFG